MTHDKLIIIIIIVITWHLRHRAAAEAGAGLTRVMVDEDNETVGI